MFSGRAGLNPMTRIIFSFNRAIMRENNVDEQERLALSLLLVQNMIVVWNVSHMSQAILKLKKRARHACVRN